MVMNVIKLVTYNKRVKPVVHNIEETNAVFDLNTVNDAHNDTTKRCSPFVADLVLNKVPVQIEVDTGASTIY
jgi:hypothetical protein